MNTYEILKTAGKSSDAADKSTPSNPEKACCANQRVLLSALEMAAMDGIRFPENAGFKEILEKLVKDKYIKPMECPRKGVYKVKFDDKENYAEVSCTCGADPEKPASQEAKEPNPDKEVKKSKLAEKAEEYRNSGKYDHDRKELFEYYDRMINIDQFKTNALEEIKKINKTTKIKTIF